MNSEYFGAEQIASRQLVHLRRIACEAYVRDDGFFDIEATLHDTKPFACSSEERIIAPEEPIHQMTLRLTIDRHFEILDVSARTHHSPYRVCGDIAPNYRQLIGLRIEPGFTQAVKRLFRGPLGCTHLTELLPTIATTAFQALRANRDSVNASERSSDSGGQSSALGGCHALRIDGEIAQRHYSHLASSGDRDAENQTEEINSK